MNNIKYTPEGQHPEDAIFKAKTFILELEKVQEKYFTKLSKDLNLTKEGEDWLFDYIYNTTDDCEYDGFDHYLEDYKKKYEDMVTKDLMYTDSSEALLTTDLGEFSPMMHMSSCEPSLGTAFPTAYNDNEPISLGLDTITINTNTVKEH